MINSLLYFTSYAYVLVYMKLVKIKIPAYKQIHETESSRKERNSNLELYRIIVMLLIVAHHYVVNSGLMSVMKEEPLHIQSIFLYLFGMWGKTGINCFVMITGYFMCKSHISLRKFMKLLFEIYFYNLIITGTFLLTGYCSPSFSTVFMHWYRYKVLE